MTKTSVLKTAPSQRWLRLLLPPRNNPSAFRNRLSTSPSRPPAPLDGKTTPSAGHRTFHSFLNSALGLAQGSFVWFRLRTKVTQESSTPAAASFILVIVLMPTRQSKTGNGAGTALMEVQNGERERVFDLYRQWGYLEADLDPLGFLQPTPHPDLPHESEYAE